MSTRSLSTLRKYKLSAEQFQMLFNLRSGRCYCCDISENELHILYATHYYTSNTKLYIDHSHDERRTVRGLLCCDCNYALESWIKRCKIIPPTGPSRIHPFNIYGYDFRILLITDYPEKFEQYLQNVSNVRSACLLID